MKLSRESRYAMRGLALLAAQPAGTILQVSEVAERAGLPGPFLAKTFGKLTRHGLLTSFRGKQRGYALARPANEIRLKEILEAVDGPDILERCIFWTEGCDDDNPCPLHDSWKALKPLIRKAMDRTTLEDVTLGKSMVGDKAKR